MKRGALVALAAAIAIAAVVLWPRDQPAREAAKPAPIARPPTGKRVDPKTLAPATLAGVVRDSANKLLARANVCVVHAEDRRCVQSGADGRYQITAVAPDDVELVTGLATYQPAIIKVTRLAPGEQRSVDVTLASGGVELTGVVEDILGGPIASASVTVDGVQTLTGDDGRFSLWLDVRGGFRDVSARASGYGPHTQPARVPGTIEIALAPESSIAGRVVDAVTGAPVPNARVIAHPLRVEVTSGADGTFTFDALGAGDVVIEAVTPTRFGRLDREIELGVGERVDGIVVQVRPGNAVVATLDVVGDRMICNPSPTLADWTFQVPKPWRDDEGRYHFDGLPAGVYTVDVGCGAVIPPLVVGEAAQAVTWRVETGGIVKGKVTFAIGQTRSPYMQVTLARVGSQKQPYTTGTVDGTFELRGIPAGTYTLRATSSSQPIAKVETFELLNDQTVERELVFETAGLGRIIGKTVHAGKPVLLGAVRAVAMNVDAVPGVVTGPIRDGTFEINAPPGTYQLSANGQHLHGSVRGTVQVKAGETVTVAALEMQRGDNTAPFEVASDERHVLSGRVVDANRAPVAGAIVTGLDRARWITSEDPTLRTTTAPDGKFSLATHSSSLAVDVYRVGGGRARATIRASQPATITLGTTGTLAGVVLRPSGAPASRFQLRIGEGGGARSENFDHTGGRFAIPDPGTYPITLTAMINGIGGQPVIIREDTAKTGITIGIPRTTTITGRIVDGETRKPIANVRINGRKGGDGWAPWFVHADQVTDHDGRFTMRELPAGALTLEITPPIETWSTQTMAITVPDANGDIGELGLAQVRRR